MRGENAGLNAHHADVHAFLFQALANRDRPETLPDYFAREAEWELVGNPATCPYTGRRSSLRAIREYCQAFFDEFEQLTFTRGDVVHDGEQFCLRVLLQLRHRHTGRRANFDTMFFLRVECGLIVDVVQFLDTAQLLRLREC